MRKLANASIIKVLKLVILKFIFGFMSKYIAVIGMEVHCELKTASRMFSGEVNGMGSEDVPNSHIDPVVTAQPGTLPVPNAQAISWVQMTGLALGCEILRKTKFDRKNYFYPDLPKGYQISQFDQPLCGKGVLQVGEREIGITRIHMEEDTGKSSHDKSGGYSLVDLNRAGVPLMELVTEPDITTGAQARAFCQELQRIIRYLEISDADMDRGQMRCEVNISLHLPHEEKLSGTKVEIKNLNSFRVVERAIDYEIIRQTEALDSGEEIIQETRGWDDARGVTFAQRVKESAHDYRYFPEPDIPPMEFGDEYIEKLRKSLPELPAVKRQRFAEEYGISQENLDVIVAERSFADYFEAVVSEVLEKRASGEVKSDEEKLVKLAANYLVNELQKYLVRDAKDIAQISITPENFAELVGIVADGTINSSAAQTVLELMYASEASLDPSNIIDEHNLAQESDTGALDAVVDEVLADNQKSVEDYRAGKENAIKYLMGQVMKQSGGKANPQIVMEILRGKLGS